MSVQVYSQGMIDIRDTLRGVTFHSIEISNDSVNGLQPRDNLFPDDDRLKIGISALFFDDSTQVDEYILWFHHDGARQWFITSQENPLTIRYNEQNSTPELLHVSISNQANESRYFAEKLEFIVSEKQFQTILDSESVSLQLTTALGNIVKNLSVDEMTALQRFDARVRKVHSQLVSSAK
jgi:uncharacterized protein YejL (UPF0352 family)